MANRSLLLALCLMCGVAYGATVTLDDGGSIRIACDGGQAPIMAADAALCEAPVPEVEPAPEPEPEPTSGTIAAKARVLSEDDDVYVMGWASGHDVQLPSGDPCLLFAFGHAASGDDNNSGRCIDTAAETKSYLWPDTETKDSLGSGIYDRDNHASLVLPDADGNDAGLLILGGDSKTGGYFDFAAGEWTHRWFSTDEYGDNLISGWDFDKPFNPAQDCSRELKKCVLFAGGESHFSNEMIFIEPTPDGPLPYAAHSLFTDGPYWKDIRDSAVIVGDYLYVYGGRQSGTGHLPQLRRYNVATESGGWERLPDGPSAGGLMVMTYDPELHALVVYGGGKSNRVHIFKLNSFEWVDLTDSAGMPHVRSHAGDYSSASGEHCYRGGVYYDENGNQLNWSKTADIWCLSLTGEATDDGAADDGVTEDDTADDGATDDVAGDDTAATGLSITTVAMPDGEKDRSWGKAPSSAIKHTAWEWNPDTKRYYSMAGDFGDPPASMSYRQDIWSYEPATDTWRLEHPYCVEDGEVAPRHPDVVGWRWDSSRHGFWYTPGLLSPSDGEFCKTGTYPRYKVMFWNPDTDTFTVPEQGTFPDKDTGIPLGSDPIQKAEYLPEQDALIKIGSNKVAIFDIKSGEWDVKQYTKAPGLPSLYRLKFAEPRVIGGDVYVAVPDHLLRYNLADNTLYPVPGVSVDVREKTEIAGKWLIWPPSAYDSAQINLTAYNVETKEQVSAPMRTSDLMYEKYGTTFAVSGERKELFYFGWNRSWNSFFTEFYLVGLAGVLE